MNPLQRRVRNRNGQAAVEMTVAVIASIALMVGSLRVWVWMVTTLVERQEAYQATRERAGRNPHAGCGDYYKPGRLSVFGENDVPGQRQPCL